MARQDFVAAKDRAPTVVNAEALLDGIAGVRADARKRKRERASAAIGIARASNQDKSAVDRILRVSESGGLRPFSRRVNYKFASSGSPSTFVNFGENPIFPFPYKAGGTQYDEQMEDDGILFIDEIAIEIPSDLKLNTYKALRNHFAIIVHYADGKKSTPRPLADVLAAEGIYARDAGVDNASAGSESVMVGTHHILQPPPGLLRLQDDEKLIVMPKESHTKLEIKRLPWQSSNPALTGETADLHLAVTFRGERLSDNHDHL